MGKVVGEVTGIMKLGYANENAFALQTIQDKKQFNDIYEGTEPSEIRYYPFRQLSKTVVGGGTFNASDFSEGNVLEESLPLMNRIPACIDHEHYSVFDIAGTVINPTWQNEYFQNGKLIPAGINAIFAINPKLDKEIQRICTLLDSEVSPKIGASVTLYFDFKASHDGFQNTQSFRESLGKMGADGQMIRRIATKIQRYKESSIVFAGADAFAKRINNEGQLQLSEADNGLFSFQVTEQDMVEVGKFFLVEKPDYDFNYFGNQITVNMNKTEKEPIKELELIGSLLVGENLNFKEVFGTESTADLSNEVLGKAFESFQMVSKNELAKLKETANLYETALTTFADLKATKEAVDKQVEKQVVSFKELQGTLIGVQADLKSKEKELGTLQSFSQSYRSIVEKAYRLSLASKEQSPDDLILDKIQNGTLEDVGVFANLFGNSLSDSFGLKCKKCGSGDVNFGSVQTSEKEVTKTQRGEIARNIRNEHFKK